MNEKTDCPIINVTVSLSSSYMDTICFALKKKKLSVSGGRPLLVGGLGPGPFGPPNPALVATGADQSRAQDTFPSLRSGYALINALRIASQAILYSFTQFDIYTVPKCDDPCVVTVRYYRRVVTTQCRLKRATSLGFCKNRRWNSTYHRSDNHFYAQSSVRSAV
jgi:hypothetical protein